MFWFFLLDIIKYLYTFNLWYLRVAVISDLLTEQEYATVYVDKSREDFNQNYQLFDDIRLLLLKSQTYSPLLESVCDQNSTEANVFLSIVVQNEPSPI